MRRIGEAFFIACVLLWVFVVTIAMLDQCDLKSLAKLYRGR